MWIILTVKELTKTIVPPSAFNAAEGTTYAEIAQQKISTLPKLANQPFTVAAYQTANHCDKVSAAVSDPIDALFSLGYKHIVLHFIPQEEQSSAPPVPIQKWS